MIAATAGLFWSFVLLGLLALVAHALDATAAVAFAVFGLGPFCALAEKTARWLRRKATAYSAPEPRDISSSSPGQGTLTPQP